MVEINICINWFWSAFFSISEIIDFWVDWILGILFLLAENWMKIDDWKALLGKCDKNRGQHKNSLHNLSLIRHSTYKNDKWFLIWKKKDENFSIAEGTWIYFPVLENIMKKIINSWEWKWKIANLHFLWKLRQDLSHLICSCDAMFK